MLGAAVTVHGRCHGTGTALVFRVDPDTGPRGAPASALVSVPPDGWDTGRLAGSL